MAALAIIAERRILTQLGELSKIFWMPIRQYILTRPSRIIFLRKFLKRFDSFQMYFPMINGNILTANLLFVYTGTIRDGTLAFFTFSKRSTGLRHSTLSSSGITGSHPASQLCTQRLTGWNAGELATPSIFLFSVFRYFSPL